MHAWVWIREPDLMSLAPDRDPKPARGCSSVLVKGLASLVTVQMMGGGACKGYLTPLIDGRVSPQISRWPPKSLCSWAARVEGLEAKWEEEWDRSEQPTGWSNSGASLLCRILGVDLPLTSSVKWSELTGDSCVLWWDSRFHQKKGRKERGREKKRGWLSGAPLKKNEASSKEMLIHGLDR